MKWSFLEFVLDRDRAELRGREGVIHLERLPLDLLCYLIENRHRVVSRDDVIEGVWNGRIVSDEAVSTAIKQIRRAVSDSGQAQRIIKTVRGRGLRFVAPLETLCAEQLPARASSAVETPLNAAPAHGLGRPGLAVLRFVSIGDSALGSILATALPGEIITAISRVRWLRVIARGSSFRYDPVDFDPQDVAAKLGVGYIVTGTVEATQSSISIGIELQSAETGTLVWSDRVTSSLENIEVTRSELVSDVVSALELAIPKFEAMYARRLSTNQFDAWSHFHIGLTHMMRFTPGDNQIAANHFRGAIALDPDFARAHAGLSLTHWQNGFMYFSGDREEYRKLALDTAQRAATIDPNDPFVHFNMGRAHWLDGDIDAANYWLERGIAINPNHAYCHYTQAIILAFAGKADLSAAAGARAHDLSPLDPLSYGIFGVRTVSAIMQEDLDAATRYAAQSMQLPGAHYHIAFTAAIAFELAGERLAAEKWRNRGFGQKPDYRSATYFETFPFQNKAFVEAAKGALRRLGVPE
ncbi:MAG: winged helix-turn-helix domain-containing protein [Pseudomonadota bacterium]